MSYTYVYNLESIMKKSLCRIIFVNDCESAMDLKAFFVEQNPDYVSEINENFHSYHKIGPFKMKNKKNLFEHLYNTKEVKEILRNEGKESAVNYIKTELDKMELDYLADRSPGAMSNLQRLRASCLYDVLDTKFDFLLCDCQCERIEDKEKRIRSKSAYFTIAEYMRCSEQYRFAMYELVWITDLSVDEMLELLGNNAKEKEYSFFTLDGINIVELNKEKLLSDFTKSKERSKEEKQFETRESCRTSSEKTAQPTCQATKTTISGKNTISTADAELAFKTARNYDMYFRTALPQYMGKDDLKKAFELYKSAAEIGHPGAQFALGDLYCYGHEAFALDKEKALYWYVIAEFNKEYNKNISNDVLAEVHYLAPMRIKNLVLQVPNGRELLRKYAGDKATALIKEAEFEAEVQKLNKMLDNKPLIDQEYFNKTMRNILTKK